jgi:hypothetical protein
MDGRTIVPATLLLVIACGDSTPAEDLTDDLADDADTGTSEGTDEVESESESDTGPIAESLAHEIDISLVEINQGIATPIVVAGEWIGPNDRNAQIVGNRDSLLRAYWTITPEFEPREILARLTLEPPGEDPVIREQPLVIDQESFAGDLSRSFTFDILAADMRSGTNFSISLWEVDPAFAALPAPELPPISPRDGSIAPIGIQPELLTIKVVLVPLVANWPNCSTEVPIDEVLGRFHDSLLMKNPTQTVELAVREQPVVVDAAPVSFWTLLPAIQQARVDDGAEPNVYYYGIVDACTYELAGFGGMAWNIVSDEKTADFERVAVGLYLANDLEWTTDTFVHEVGHLQGLFHVECPGKDAAGPDASYPYEDGVIGVWGFGIRDFELRSPTAAHDFMSYCYDGNWTSDWTWSKTFNRVRTLTSWDAEDGGGPSQPQGTLLIGMLGDQGGEQWWTIPGEIPATNLARDRVHVRAFAGDEVREPNATWHRPPEGDATIVTVELPGAAMPDRIETFAGPPAVWQPRAIDRD